RAAGHHGLPCGGARASTAVGHGNERVAARDGAHRAQRSMQPRPSDVDVRQHGRPRSAVPARPMSASRPPAAPGIPPVILVMGPTGAGKTDLAIRLAERFPIEIVSVDSAMVYRGLDIGTGKPPAEILARHPHHLVD